METTALTSTAPLPIFEKAYDLTLWLLPHIARFPRNHRFVLGERIERDLYDIHDLLTEARYSQNPRPQLRRLNILLDRLRLRIRLCKDLELISVRRYGHAAERLEEIGRMCGGWLRSKKDRTAR